MSLDLLTLRKQLRRQRRQVNSFEQRHAEQQILSQLRRFNRFKTAKHIGLYLDAFGEIQTTQIIKLCFQQGKSVYLPKICNMNQHLVWVKITAKQWHNRRFNAHHLGMLEPTASRGQQVSRLDLLVMPLLACDLKGTRLGMGGGFYDRTLAAATTRPYRLGLAHEFQFISTPLLRRSWDQPIDALLTPKKIRYF